MRLCCRVAKVEGRMEGKRTMAAGRMRKVKGRTTRIANGTNAFISCWVCLIRRT